MEPPNFFFSCVEPRRHAAGTHIHTGPAASAWLANDPGERGAPAAQAQTDRGAEPVSGDLILIMSAPRAAGSARASASGPDDRTLTHELFLAAARNA